VEREKAEVTPSTAHRGSREADPALPFTDGHGYRYTLSCVIIVQLPHCAQRSEMTQIQKLVDSPLIRKWPCLLHTGRQGMEWGLERLGMRHWDTTRNRSPEACHNYSWAIILISWNTFTTSNSITVIVAGEGANINKV